MGLGYSEPIRLSAGGLFGVSRCTVESRTVQRLDIDRRRGSSTTSTSARNIVPPPGNPVPHARSLSVDALPG